MDIVSLSGVGPAKAALLREESGIETVEDLLYLQPRRYLDHSVVKRIADCFVNETVTVWGRIIDVDIRGGGRKFLEVVIDDGSDCISGIYFGGIQYFRKIFTIGDEIVFSGKIQFLKTKRIIHPEFDFIQEESGVPTINTGRIVPLYPSTEKLKSRGLDSRGFRRLIRQALDLHLDKIHDSLDMDILERNGLPSLCDAIRSMHFPSSLHEAELARKRLAFNEMFFLSFYLQMSRRYIRENSTRTRNPGNRQVLHDFIDTLPFPLTGGQRSAIDEIIRDLNGSWPMNRLLQGDVGAGKTLVAITSALYCATTGLQTAFMAPTEVLALQHYRTLSAILPEWVTTVCVTGNMPPPARKEVNESIAAGNALIAVGTHALIQESIVFKNLGLIIVDEQHRFGLSQRARLRGKGKEADILVMSATPIPRSLYMTLYGDLDISVIREKPAGRKEITTLAFPESRLPGVYNSLRKYISQGRQVFYIVPLVEESEKTDLKSAAGVYENLSRDVFPDLRIEILHGRLPQPRREEIMSAFREGQIDLLVATTVIEVGIDIPNASVIVIHHAERFGLSQLHQMRGRVGRGSHQSFCVMIYPDDIQPESMERINVMTQTDDGFVIAEEDLKLRGAGDITGTAQHGRALEFEFTNLVHDLPLIQAARGEASTLVNGMNMSSTEHGGFSNGRWPAVLEGIRTRRILDLLS